MVHSVMSGKKTVYVDGKVMVKEQKVGVHFYTSCSIFAGEPLSRCVDYCVHLPLQWSPALQCFCGKCTVASQVVIAIPFPFVFARLHPA